MQNNARMSQVELNVHDVVSHIMWTGGAQPLAVEVAKAMLYLTTIPFKVSYYVIGGLCDACGYAIGAVLKSNQNQK